MNDRMRAVSRYFVAITVYFFLLGRLCTFAADPIVRTAVQLQTPKKSKDRTEGDLDKVLVNIWIPDGVDVVRGAIVNPFYLPLVERTDYQKVARVWRFALIGANYFGVRAVYAVCVFGENRKSCSKPTVLVEGQDPKSEAARKTVEK